ncbi:unnamed protein product [Gadus morhua 'NCC']
MTTRRGNYEAHSSEAACGKRPFECEHECEKAGRSRNACSEQADHIMKDKHWRVEPQAEQGATPVTPSFVYHCNV